MVNVLEKQLFLLDAALPTFDELAKKGRATIVSPTMDSNGLAFDISNLAHRLHPFTDLVIKRRDGVTRKFDSRFTPKPVRRYTIEIEIDESKKWEPEYSGSSRFPITILRSPETSQKISVVARGAVDPMNNGLINAIRQLVPLPEEKQKVSLFLGYIHDFRAHTFFYDPEHLFGYQGKVRQGLNYPVSTQQEILLSPETFRFIQEPLIWNGLSHWAFIAFNVMAGKDSIDEIIRDRYPNEPEFPVKRIDEAKPFCFGLMEALVEKLRFEVLFGEFRCPDEYTGFLLSQPLKSLQYHANPDTVDGEAVKKLVRVYNREYAEPSGKKLITPNDLCYATRPQLVRPR